MNASDASQVNAAKAKTKALEGRRIASLKNVLATDAGKELLWWWLEQAGIYETPWSMDDGLRCKNIGRGDFGRFMLAQILSADMEAYFEMQRNAKKLNEGDSND